MDGTENTGLSFGILGFAFRVKQTTCSCLCVHNRQILLSLLKHSYFKPKHDVFP